MAQAGLDIVVEKAAQLANQMGLDNVDDQETSKRIWAECKRFIV